MSCESFTAEDCWTVLFSVRPDRVQKQLHVTPEDEQQLIWF
jgi:hypothetical protein